MARADLVMVNHRVAALLASYFDILFALNRLPHPGEKWLLAVAAEQCLTLPPAMAADVLELLRAAGAGEAEVLAATDRLVDALDQLLLAEALITR